MAWARVAKLAELWDGEMLACEADGRKLLLVRAGDVIRAYADRCCHQGVPLSQGHLAGCVLTCNAHHWQYDVLSGCGINPASARLQAYPVTVHQGQILVQTD